MADQDSNLDFNIDSLDVFDEEQRKVFIDFMRHTEQKAEEKAKATVEETLEDMGLSEDDLNLTPKDASKLADSKRLDAMRQIWNNDGYIDGASERLTVLELCEKDKAAFDKRKMMKDTQFSTDHPLLIPRVISEIAREAIEPNIVLTPLLETINFSAGTQIVFPAWGQIHAADIPEAGEYPERSLELAGEVTATIGKSGLAIKMTDEMIRYSMFDVMNRHVRAAGKALIRHKEKKVFTMMDDNAIAVIDNSSTGTAVKSSTGRSATGAYNGSLTLDDLFYIWATMVDTGFVPDTMIIHPLAWQIFANEGIARAFGFENGQAAMMWQLAQGSPGSNEGWRIGGLNQETSVTNPGNVATTFTAPPAIAPYPLRVLVSPFVGFTSASNRADVYFIDSREFGVLVVDEGVTTEEWDDPARDIRKIKFRERYAIAPINSGKGIAKLTDIFVGERSVDFLDLLKVDIAPDSITGGSQPLSGDTTFKGQV